MYENSISQSIIGDTDSFLFSVKGVNFKDEIRCDIRDRFDTSDYDENQLRKHQFERCNKKIFGLFKDEVNGFPLTRFVGLKAKCYGYEIEHPNNEIVSKKRCKGISKKVVEKYTLEPYTNCLNTGQSFTSVVMRIESKLHQIMTVTEKKTSITIFDDKRFQIPNSFETLAWFHKDIIEKYGVDVDENT